MCSLTQLRLSSHHHITLKQGKDYKIMSQSEKLFVLRLRINVSGAKLQATPKYNIKEYSKKRKKSQKKNAHVNCRKKDNEESYKSLQKK